MVYFGRDLDRRIGLKGHEGVMLLKQEKQNSEEELYF